MLNYTGLPCPVCEKEFTDGDDIVVCPVCGAPYHRACYEEKGSCIFEDLHQEGKDWAPPAQEQPEFDLLAGEASSAVKTVECLKCGTLNDRNARFCARCGTLLPPYATPSEPGEDAESNHARTYGSTGSFVMPPFGVDPMGGVNPADMLDQKVTYGDASKVVRVRTDYYMPVFRYIRQSGRNKFNFSAFFFSGAWLLYRKQYRAGIFVSVLMFLLQIAYQCALWFLADPTLEMLAQQIGLDLTGALGYADILALSELATQDIGLYLKFISPVLVLFAILAVMIVVGVQGNRMYLKHCVETAREVQAAERADDPDTNYLTRGGVNSMAALCFTVCYMILQTFLPLLFL